jgi:hypothetical protein
MRTRNVRNPECWVTSTACRAKPFIQQDQLGLGLGHHVGNGLKSDPPQGAERRNGRGFSRFLRTLWRGITSHARKTPCHSRGGAKTSTTSVSSGKKPSCSTLPGITATSPPTIDRLSYLTRKSILPLSIQTIWSWGCWCEAACTRLHFPPHDHALFKDTPLNFIGDALPRQSRERAEARHYRHYIPRFFFGARLINF